MGHSALGHGKDRLLEDGAVLDALPVRCEDLVHAVHAPAAPAPRQATGRKRAARLRPPLASGDPLPQPRSPSPLPLRNVAARPEASRGKREVGAGGGGYGARVIGKWDWGVRGEMGQFVGGWGWVGR